MAWDIAARTAGWVVMNCVWWMVGEMADCRLVTTVAPVADRLIRKKVLTEVGTRARLMSMRDAVTGAVPMTVD